MRLIAVLSYLVYLVREVLAGAWRVTRSVVSPGAASSPGIVEFPLRCRTDLQITALSASITITPGTLVLGTAEAREGTPPTLFVHALFAPDRESVLADLRDMETRLLRAAGAPAESGPSRGGARP
jgi:multicomponent Na+:H+ antiporter subunit E